MATPQSPTAFQESFSFNSVKPLEIVNLIEKTAQKEGRLSLFNSLSSPLDVQVFEYLPLWLQKELLHELPTERVATLLNSVSPDDRTRFLQELPPSLVSQLLKYLSPEERLLSIELLGYPPNSIGRLMTPDYLAIKLDWTVKEVLDYIREKGRDSETINVLYATDDQGKLLDDFRIRTFFLAPLNARVWDLADFNFIALTVDEPEEIALNIFRKFDRAALPVVDQSGILLGIVTLDDILSVTVDVDTEDMQKIGGVIALKEPYLNIPFLTLMRKRAGWLLILFLGEMLTATAMGYFEAEIAKAVVLALFVPLIISSGGNAGSQAATLIIRAMALGEVKLKDWWRIMRREIFSGIFLGLILGSIGFLRVVAWTFFTDIYGNHWFLISLTVFFALLGVVLWGTLTGAMLPLLLQRLGFDPAASSTPFIATLVDVTGLIIYFSIAIIILQGTLL